ncbi:MAG TPA: FAD-binding oxidoreductase [Candidatus Limnocylindrales bacterium]|nr:FAD-binding oxidoreductase [Candidatus Limnocylindrales bacterium]
MLNLPDTDESYWKSFYDQSLYPSLRVDLGVDVAIAGGGITGLTAAYLLKKSGLKVAVLEKNTIGSGTTGGTTGKVTSQHNLIYHSLQKRLGENTARIYGEANQAALERIAQVIAQEKIKCDWQRDDNFVYTADPKKVGQFQQEAATALRLGLPASFETKLNLPFEVTGAVKFANQAKFNAQKYVLGLAKAVHGNGSYVFENSNVTSFQDGRPAVVKTKAAKITAKDIIVATKMPAFPLAARFACAIMEYPTNSYIVASRTNSDLKGMYISPDKNHYSILPVVSGKEKLLLIGGENHIPGLGSPTKRYQRLANYAEEHFGFTSIGYRWKAMDYLAYDDVPLVGKVYPWSKHLYTATAFHKWGLSTSMVAGTILHDMLLGQPNPWMPVFNSMRTKPITSIPHGVAQLFK